MNKYWSPIPAVVEYVQQLAKGVVIDIGGNDTYSFPGATTVGWQGKIEMDLNRDDLPFADRSIDFAFCRHTLEDMADPEHLLSEMARVAKAGYIETPSPMVEMSRSVDAAGPHCGYTHHRWFCVPVEDVFYMLAKYPVVEHLASPEWNELLSQPYYWNVYFLWSGQLKYRVMSHEDGIDLSIKDHKGLPVHYSRQIDKAITRGISNAQQMMRLTLQPVTA